MYDDNEELVSCARLGCPETFVRFPANKKYCSLRCKRSSETTRSLEYPEEDVILYNTMVTHNDDKIYEQRDFLRKENTRLFNLSERYKRSVDEAYDLILKTVKENIKSITVDPIKTITSRSIDKAPSLVFNPWNSDTQIGKVTPSYNTQKAYEAVELYTDYVIEHHKDFSLQYNCNVAHVYFLGDIVEGENIFPTQPHLLDTSVFRQATIDGPTMYGNQLRRLLERFDQVIVTCVIGNHGRLGKFSNPESNMDRVLYQTLYWMFLDEPRIQFVIPQGHGESMFWAVDKIGDYSTLLVHGDQFGPPTTQSTYASKILGWKAGAIPVHFDDVAFGHYHQNVKFTIGNTVARCAGSTESCNTFAQERLGRQSRPSQHLQLVDPRSGVFWESDIFLD